ncbi:MAG TPA: hypothetical protein VNG93_12490 [Candidatus Dormibacteraeota bacterium]|nr:hypothetical protein [Candidatus Dormibacteraeota bacterium]
MKKRSGPSLTNGGAEEFQTQRSHHHYEHLLEFWHSHGCPECGASELRPGIESAVDSVSRCDGVCAQCGQGFVWDLDRPALTSGYPD